MLNINLSEIPENGEKIFIENKDGHHVSYMVMIREFYISNEDQEKVLILVSGTYNPYK